MWFCVTTDGESLFGERMENSPLKLVLSRTLRIIALVCLTSFGTTTLGCGSDGEPGAQMEAQSLSDTRRSDGPGRARYRNLTSDGLNTQTVDINSDGNPDQWVFKGASGVVRIERDMNFDNRIDVWQYPGADGVVEEEEMDLDLDGVVDVVVYFKDGVVVRKETSIDFQEGFSIVKVYDGGGNLLRVERDEDGDSTPDVWEYYEDGRRVRIGWDADQDGIPEKFDTVL